MTGRGGRRRPVTAEDAQLAEPAPDPGHIDGRARLRVPVESLGEAADRLAHVRLRGKQDAKVLYCRRPGPWVFVLRGCLGKTCHIPADQAQAVSRGRGDGPEPGIVTSEGVGGMEFCVIDHPEL